ncbi:MAG: DUF5662 family protein [Oscillospiraceae bacterium]|nr:DUF5662 family protein [Oscillospiraceae bacterium]
MFHPFRHFQTITRHRHAVIRNCFRAGIPLRGLLHDLSKYSPVEFIPGAKYWSGDKSPNIGERRACGYSLAWMHHKGRNRHHFEYWTDYAAGANGMVGMPMPPKYLAEMFCDRVAASKIYLGKAYTDAAPYEYYCHRKDGYLMHPDTSAALERLLRMLRDEGEEKTFAFIRHTLREKRGR